MQNPNYSTQDKPMYPNVNPQPYPVYQAPYPPTQPPQPVFVQQSPGVVIVNGACPHCRIGYPIEGYTIGGIILAILFFPIGILCCLAMKERSCSHCGISL